MDARAKCAAIAQAQPDEVGNTIGNLDADQMDLTILPLSHNVLLPLPAQDKPEQQEHDDLDDEIGLQKKTEDREIVRNGAAERNGVDDFTLHEP